MALTSTLVYAAVSFFITSQAATADIRTEEIRKLRSCLELAETDPEAAYEMSLTWLYEGNRPGARECKAVSLIGLGDFEEGALQLEALADAPDGGTIEDRAHFLSRAGNAWLQAGLPDEALLAFDNGLTLYKENFDLYKYRAQAYLALGDWEKAEEDLDLAIGSQPGDINSWLYRAQARLGQKRYDDAMDDIVQARTLDSENIDALLLRGRIREEKRLAEE